MPALKHDFAEKSLPKHIFLDKSLQNLDFLKEPLPKNDFLEVTFEKEGLYKYLCSFHASPEGDWGMVGSVVVGDIDYEDYSNFQKADAVQSFSGEIRLVPREYETIQDAVNSSNPGDMILISPGIYYEEVIVNVPSLTIRGVDRNKTIVDGEFERANGFLVAGVDGVALENITARNALLNGFYCATGEGYRGSYLTAYNNGDYGVYAFDAVDGVINFQTYQKFNGIRISNGSQKTS